MVDEPLFIPSDTADVAVRITEGEGPTVLWCGGFRSDMMGGKAVALADWGARTGRRVVRFDYRGHGESGGRFEDLAMSDWLADAERVMDRFCPGPTVVVGSSMGGWIGLLLARARLRAGTPLAGLVLIAPAADFTERLMWPQLPDDRKAEIEREGLTLLPSAYGDPYPITRRLIEDGRNHLLYGDAPIETGCPVHILQGVMDEDVPYRHALELVERLAHDDVVLTLVKDGDHRLSREEDIARLIAAVEGIVDDA
ncbi:alpha/beta hydrolase [Acuticoccus mangrovi]|uniref:Palmitoyl-protein thioesterase ABHD10, mitochondrial n=1 Tax=Acuticoccus mangrovi TaxID=2796142 RepID=A0A934IQE7_9HYPH|nr:alpha/beta hydrolase [Acuticoccus mangrovi]MBJ3776145.1 alpha/beta hydrolase [Acuticoccus mangrovi]